MKRVITSVCATFGILFALVAMLAAIISVLYMLTHYPIAFVWAVFAIFVVWIFCDVYGDTDDSGNWEPH